MKKYSDTDGCKRLDYLPVAEPERQRLKTYGEKIFNTMKPVEDGGMLVPTPACKYFKFTLEGVFESVTFKGRALRSLGTRFRKLINSSIFVNDPTYDMPRELSDVMLFSTFDVEIMLHKYRRPSSLPVTVDTFGMNISVGVLTILEACLKNVYFTLTPQGHVSCYSILLDKFYVAIGRGGDRNSGISRDIQKAIRKITCVAVNGGSVTDCRNPYVIRTCNWFGLLSEPDVLPTSDTIRFKKCGTGFFEICLLGIQPRGIERLLLLYVLFTQVNGNSRWRCDQMPRGWFNILKIRNVITHPTEQNFPSMISCIARRQFTTTPLLNCGASGCCSHTSPPPPLPTHQLNSSSSSESDTSRDNTFDSSDSDSV